VDPRSRVTEGAIRDEDMGIVFGDVMRSQDRNSKGQEVVLLEC